MFLPFGHDLFKMIDFFEQAKLKRNYSTPTLDAQRTAYLLNLKQLGWEEFFGKTCLVAIRLGKDTLKFLMSMHHISNLINNYNYNVIGLFWL